MPTVRCRECGFENGEGATRCAVCHASLDGSSEAAPTRSAPAERAEREPTPWGHIEAPRRGRAKSGDPKVGVARDVKFRSEPNSEQVCTFRVERQDAQGSPLPPVPVEMRGLSFSGSLSNGDWVQLPKLPRGGRTLEPRAVVNLTNGARLERKGSRRRRMSCGLLVFLIVAAVFIAIFIAVASSMSSGGY
jgi:hypothetical protein